MPRHSSQQAVEAVGNRYDLVHIASIRARELSRGAAPLIPTTNGFLVTALAEIQVGEVGREYLDKLKQR